MLKLKNKISNKNFLNYYFFIFLFSVIPFKSFFFLYKNVLFFNINKKYKNSIFFSKILKNYNFNQCSDIILNKDWKFRFNPEKEINQISNNFFKNKKKNKFFFKFFNLIYFFNTSSSSRFLNISNSTYSNFYLIKKNSILVLDIVKVLNRWENSYNLLFNIFYYNYSPLIFSNYWHKSSTTSLNWFFNKWELNLWKTAIPFFSFKLNQFGELTNYFFYQLKKKSKKFALITDCSYHYSTLYYLKKHDFYSIGLTSFNINPWLVNYPIFSIFDSFLIQSFFLKLILYSYKYAISFKFYFSKKIWFNSFFKKFIKNNF